MIKAIKEFSGIPAGVHELGGAAGHFDNVAIVFGVQHDADSTVLMGMDQLLTSGFRVN